MSSQFELSFPDREKGFFCKCCGSYCKLYKRALNSNMATTLIRLYQHKIFDFVHVEDFLRKNGYKRSGDFPYLVYWGFLEKKIGERNDKSRRNGFYKLTGRALMFIEGTITAKEKILIYNNKFEGFYGNDITIDDALGKSFSYSELMGLNGTN